MALARILVSAIAAVLAVGLPLHGAEEAAGSGLPAADCVRMLRQARLEHDAGDATAELATLRAAAEEFPGELAPTYALLEYDRDHGLPEEERRRFEELLSRHLADLERPLPVSLLRRVALDPEVDEALLRDLAASVASRLGPPGGEDADLLGLLTDVQERLGQEREAAATLERLWRRTGSTETAWRLVRLEFGLGRLPEALAVLESVDEIREALWPSYVVTLAEVGRLDDARAALERRLETAGTAAAESAPDLASPPGAASPFLPELVEELAWRFHDAGRAAEAEGLFRRALALDPQDAGLSEVLLHLYATDDERATRAAEVAREWQQQSDPQVLLDEGTQRLAAGDAEGAFDLLERAAEGFPRLEAAWYNLGMAAYGLERWQRAAEALGRAAELNPDRAASHFFRGVSLANLERCGEAVSALKRALELDPARTHAHYYLSGCYRALGQPEAAERHRALYQAAPPGR